MVGGMTTTETRKTPRRELNHLKDIADIASLITWRVIDISHRPYAGSWSMNPSVHFDGETWRCVIRCADYAMPDGVAVRSLGSPRAYVTTRNAMLILDPVTLQATAIYRMQENDNQPRIAQCASTGFEDMRLFVTDSGGLQGVAASLHLDRRPPQPTVPYYVPQSRGGTLRRGTQQNRPQGRLKPGGVAQMPPRPGTYMTNAPRQDSTFPAEQVILSFDQNYNIIDAQPLRGSWGSRTQKNWSPFDNATDPMFLFSVEEGKIHDVHGPIAETENNERAAIKNHGTTEVRLVRRSIQLSSGRTSAQGRFDGLRGGTQLINVGDKLDHLVGYEVPGGAWISLAHDMRHINNRKFYWHVLYAVDSTGALIAISQSFKLDPSKGIEFAAGLAVDPSTDRAVISYGIDDMECHLGVTSFEELLGLLHPLGQPRTASPTVQGDFVDEGVAVDQVAGVPVYYADVNGHEGHTASETSHDQLEPDAADSDQPNEPVASESAKQVGYIDAGDGSQIPVYGSVD